ncbi:MAG: acetyl-CoA decarbonylase/synthase complex subunit gamma [Vicinamibacteria bacterium]|jgi:acetyl-CoA decarbonylase/synthase complex subunit gamma|nr:acetyl-CoA decarbonylase/synthase complex subunit gamma [Vicinamibacteria bacterium]
MGLTGLQIFKLLPNTNCKKCGYPTCLAFAMKLAAGKESLDKCDTASDAARAALGAASAPPIKGVTIGSGARAVTVGEETVFFRHEKTFVRQPPFLRVLDPGERSDAEIEAQLSTWEALAIERAGELFRVDGIALRESPNAPERCAVPARLAAQRGWPVALVASSVAGARAILAPIRASRPLLVPAGDARDFIPLAIELSLPMVVRGRDLEDLATIAAEAAQAGVADLLLEPPQGSISALHRDLSLIRRGALERLHPGLAYPTFLRVGAGEIERAAVGIAKYAALIVIDDAAGETWLPLWTLRQNIYTDPQKPLQMNPGLYSIGEPNEQSPLLVTTNFSLTYFIVSTEVEATGVASHLAVVDAEGMSVLTAWSAGKFSGERVAKALREMGGCERALHRKVIIPGYVAAISGELEDALGDGWQVLIGPQEAADIAPFLRDVWGAA